MVFALPKPFVPARALCAPCAPFRFVRFSLFVRLASLTILIRSLLHFIAHPVRFCGTGRFCFDDYLVFDSIMPSTLKQLRQPMPASCWLTAMKKFDPVF
jgi:hypothetical protein